MEKIYDAVVIGSGPAGAAFLYSVPASYKIASISKKASRKVCGGLLSPSSVKVLSEMNLTVPDDIYAKPSIRVIRTIDLGSGISRYYPRNYLNVDRYKFDSWLVSLSSEKVDSYYGVCIGFEKVGDLYHAFYKSDSETHCIKCRSIIGADGANSVVRRRLFKETSRKDVYTAIQQWFNSDECEGHEGDDGFSCVFDNSVSDSYAWSFTKDGKIAFGGAYPKKNSRERFENEKKKLSDRGIKFGEPLETEACTVVFGKDFQKFVLGAKNERIYLVGEAAGLISPSSLEGISSALISGSVLGKMFDPNKNLLSKYSKELLGLKLKLTAKRFKSAVLCSPFLRFLIMKSGITSVKKK